MLDREQSIRELNRRIQRYNNDINELNRDVRVVKNQRTVNFIRKEIDRLKRFKERKEFELWKLEREG